MTNKHTLNTPWRIVSMGNAKFPDAITIEDCKGGFPLVKDNSQEIVRVVNNFDGLLAECERTQSEIISALNEGIDKHFSEDMLRRWLKGVEEVINKAKGN